MEFFTIGVYNSSEKEFFDNLLENNIDTFCDIRQRRGVRGAKYSFVNSNRLQQKLNDLEIKYGYIPDLAPTSEIRELQKEIDLEKGELKSERQELGKVFVIEYKNRILKNFDFPPLNVSFIYICNDLFSLFASKLIDIRFFFGENFDQASVKVSLKKLSTSEIIVFLLRSSISNILSKL